MKNTKPYYWKLVEALEDLLSTEECVCCEAELKKGTCSVCTYKKLLAKIPAKG
jgi:hypothetical protein